MINIDMENLKDIVCAIRVRLNTWYYDIRYGIKSVLYWLPVIWKDRNWEYEAYTYQILYHKLKALKNRHYGDIFEGGEWAENYIKMCLDIFDKYFKLSDQIYPPNIEEPQYKWIETDQDIAGQPTKRLITLYNQKGDEEEIKSYWEWQEKYLAKLIRTLYHILEKRGGSWWD